MSNLFDEAKRTLTVNKSVSVQRKRRRELRAYFHQIGLNPAEFSNQKQKALGYAAWIFNHHESEGRTYLEIARSIPDPEPSSCSAEHCVLSPTHHEFYKFHSPFPPPLGRVPD